MSQVLMPSIHCSMTYISGVCQAPEASKNLFISWNPPTNLGVISTTLHLLAGHKAPSQGPTTFKHMLSSSESPYSSQGKLLVSLFLPRQWLSPGTMNSTKSPEFHLTAHAFIMPHLTPESLKSAANILKPGPMWHMQNSGKFMGASSSGVDFTSAWGGKHIFPLNKHANIMLCDAKFPCGFRTKWKTLKKNSKHCGLL